MLNKLRMRVVDWLYRPRLDWIQVEINSLCNARCIYCPATVSGKGWPRRVMKLETFARLLPTIARSTRPSPWRHPLFHLQGWGEPLLHSDLFEMIELTKRAGCEVGTTTNGILIDDGIARRLVDSGLDMISFSLAGIDGRNDEIRVGTRLDHVLDSIATLDRQKRLRGSDRPAIHIAYMLLKSGLDEIERLPRFFAGRGIDHVVVSTLSFVPAPALFEEAVRPANPREYDALAERLAATREEASRLGLGFHANIPRPGTRPDLCAENVQAALVVSVDGKVTPCMFNRFQGDGDVCLSPAPFVFGDLSRQSLADVWWDASYLRFRRSFRDGRPPERCLPCAKLNRR